MTSKTPASSTPNVLITGASRGLGRALAHELAAAQAKVLVVARNREALKTVVDSINRSGGWAQAIVADLADPKAPLAIAHQAQAALGHIDVVVHNASALGPTPLQLLLDTEADTLRTLTQVNLVSPFELSKRLAPSMALRGRGLLVQVSSDAAVEAYPSWGAYSVTKAAADHLTRIWAAELGQRGVRAISFDPGEMDTQMHADAIPDADTSTLARPEEVARRLAHLILHPASVANGARVTATSVVLPNKKEVA